MQLKIVRKKQQQMNLASFKSANCFHLLSSLTSTKHSALLAAVVSLASRSMITTRCTVRSNSFSSWKQLTTSLFKSEHRSVVLKASSPAPPFLPLTTRANQSANTYLCSSLQIRRLIERRTIRLRILVYNYLFAIKL